MVQRDLAVHYGIEQHVILVRVLKLDMTQNLMCVSNQLPASPTAKQHKIRTHESVSRAPIYVS